MEFRPDAVQQVASAAQLEFDRDVVLYRRPHLAGRAANIAAQVGAKDKSACQHRATHRHRSDLDHLPKHESLSFLNAFLWRRHGPPERVVETWGDLLRLFGGR